MPSDQSATVPFSDHAVIATTPTPANSRESSGITELLRRPTIATFVPLIGGCLLAWFVFMAARNTEDQRIRAEFLKEVERHMGNVRGDLIHGNDALYSLRNLFLLAGTVRPAEFNRVAEDVIHRHPAIRTVAWVPRVSANEREVFTEWARANISETYRVHEFDPDGRPRPVRTREESYPVYYQTPVDAGELKLGEDLAARLDWAETLQLSRDVARVVLSPRLPDRAGMRQSTAVLAVAPVYQHQAKPDTAAERQRLAAGFLVAELDVEALLRNAIVSAPQFHINVIAHDVSNNRETLLHTTLPYGATEPEDESDSLRRNGQTESLTLAGRAWRLKFIPAESWIASVDSNTPQVALLACLAFSALVSRLLRTVALRNRRVEQMVGVRTAELLGANRRLSAEISRREQTEKERTDSEERFRVTFEEAPAGIGHVTLEGRYIRVNDRLCEITGYSREELLARRWQEITHPDDVKLDEEAAIGLFTAGRASYSLEKRYVRKDGSHVWVNLTVALVRDGAGDPSYFISIVTDQTEYRHAREDLQSERNLLRTLVDGLPDSVYIKDREGRYVMNNLADQRLLGVRRPEDVVGRTVFDFAPLRKHADLYFKDDRRVLETGQPVIARDEPFTLPDGSEGWFCTTKLPLRNAAGEITGLIGITADVTRRKRDEQDKIKMTRMLETTQKLEAMGLLAGGIAHDFNNLLTGIHGHAGLIRLQSGDRDDLLPSIHQIEQAARRASELCQQMLDYSGQHRNDRQRLDLNATIKQTLPLLQHSIHKKAQLTFEPAENLPALDADASQFRQVVMNLVINASDALKGDNGVIRVETGVIRADREYLDGLVYDDQLPPTDYLFIDVIDNGSGMSKEICARVFDPFYTTKKEGRGLGLATVIGIVRSHGGGIRIHSQPDQGTVFRVLMPACDAPAEQFPDDEQTGWNWHGAGRVLVIDDEETVRTVSARILEALGFSPTLAKDGQEGAELFRQHAADYKMVLTDLSMPIMDGAEACRRIKSMRHDIPIVLMSGYWEEQAKDDFDTPVSGFLKKPFSPEQLRDLVKTAVADSERIVGEN